VTYDAPGNMTNDGLVPVAHSYYYDAENRLIQVDGTFGTCSGATACYTYDAEGRRVGKTLGAGTVNYLYDLAGKQVAEVSSAGVWNRGEVYAGSRHLATYSGGTGGVTYFSTVDWLGTERLRTGISGPIVESCTSLPFGDGLTCTGSDPSPMHFIGQQLDSETNLTHMEFRSYSTIQGRWTSMDPARMGAVNPANPQTWNLYAYVMNNPLSLVDPSGLEGVGQQWGGLPGSAGNCKYSDSDICVTVAKTEKPPDKSPNAGVPPMGNAGTFFVGSDNRVTAQLKRRFAVQQVRVVNRAVSKAAASREVDYYPVNQSSVKIEYSGHKLTLSEKFLGQPVNAGIANPPQSQNNEFEDGQSVKLGEAYSVERRWQVDDQPAGVVGQKGTTFDYEVNHYSVEPGAGEPFQTDYGNDPKQ